MGYYCWHHPWSEYVGRRNYKHLSFYVSGWNVLLMGTRWVLAIIEDYMMVEYVDLPKGSNTWPFLKKMMNCSCKVGSEHSLLVFNRVYALYFDVGMNCYLFMRSIWCKSYDKSPMFNFVVVIIINMMLLCPYFFADTYLSQSMWTCFLISIFAWGQARCKLGGVDTSILHHVFLLLFIMFLSIIMLFGVILMLFLS